MAGDTGFEPVHSGVKVQCLTAWRIPNKKTSDVLLSQVVDNQVSSALRNLTSVFGMGTGVAFSLLPLDFYHSYIISNLILCVKMIFFRYSLKIAYMNSKQHFGTLRLRFHYAVCGQVLDLLVSIT